MADYTLDKWHRNAAIVKALWPIVNEDNAYPLIKNLLTDGDRILANAIMRAVPPQDQNTMLA
jgi:hypothetical protein